MILTMAPVLVVASLVAASARDGEPDRLKATPDGLRNPGGPEDGARLSFRVAGAGDVFSNHTSHSNRLVPVYLFGKKADLAR